GAATTRAPIWVVAPVIGRGGLSAEALVGAPPPARTGSLLLPPARPGPRSEDSVGGLPQARPGSLPFPPSRPGPRSEDSVGGLPQARPGSVPSAAAHSTGDRGRGGVIADGSGGRGTCTARPPRDSRAQRCSR